MATGDLTTVAAVQASLGIASGQDVALLQTLVTAASALIKTYCSRDFTDQDYTEMRNGHGGAAMLLGQYPVTAVTSVTVDGVPVPPAQGTGTATGYVFDSQAVYLRGYCFTRGVQNVAIAYHAGLVAIPADLAQACVDIVAVKYKRRTDPQVSGKTLNGETINYTMADIPANAKTVLNQYRKVVHAWP